jgi:peptidoglycan hydrolase CwlO-like protein
MKRSFLLSALVLALAAAACGGGNAEGEGAKDPSGEKKDEGSGDPIADLKASVDAIQKEVDDLFAPIKNADATIDGVAKLPADLKGKAKKLDAKKLMAEAAKLIDGGEANIESLGLEAEAKAVVQERFDKVKALVASIKALPEKVTQLPAKFEELPKKLAAAAPAAAKAAAKAKAPFGVSAEDKKKAEEQIKMLEDFKTQIPQKVDGWKKDATEVPAKAKDLPAKMKAAFTAK